MEPEPYLFGGLHFDLKKIACAPREDVVMVGRGSAAGACQGAESSAGCSKFDLLVY